MPDLAKLNAKLQAEIAVRERAEALFRRIISATPNGIILTDAEGKVRLINSRVATMFGYGEAELLGQPLEMLLPPAIRDHHQRLREAYMEAPQERMMGEGRDLFGLHRLGHTFPVEVGLNPIQLPEGMHVLASIVDITERKRAEDQLRRHAAKLEKSNRELDEFAYVASHDLRSPLQGVKNLASWIKEDNEHLLPEESRRHLDLMHQRLARMERLLDDLLEYSRVGRMHQAVSEVDVGQLLETIVDSLPRPEAMQVVIDRSLPTLLTMRAPLDLVFRNLIQNAIKHHHRAQGRIEITCQEEGDSYLFGVRDDGPGIGVEFHDRIFKMFETLKPRDTVEGSGMGLSIVQKTVETIGGRIYLESSKGAGAAFYFTWPKRLSTGEDL